MNFNISNITNNSFTEMVFYLHSYIDYATPKKISHDLKTALKSGKAYDYLKKSGLDDEMIAAFKVQFGL